MDVELLSGRNLIRSPEMQQVARPTALRKVARILDEPIRRLCELPVEEES